MVGLNLFLWALICPPSAFATIETGSFCLAASYLGITCLVGLGMGPLLARGLSFACIPGC